MPRRPVERVVDLLVAIPVSSLAAARSLAPAIGRAARSLATVRLDEPMAEPGAGHARPRSVADTDDTVEATAVQSDEGALGVTAGAELPIDGYDQLAARQIIDRLGSLTPAELAVIEAHERAHRNRSTVLGRIAQLRA